MKQCNEQLARNYYKKEKLGQTKREMMSRQQMLRWSNRGERLARTPWTPAQGYPDNLMLIYDRHLKVTWSHWKDGDILKNIGNTTSA
jgi:hypothetical protein